MILAERYEVIRPLAQGGFGKTFLACDRHLPNHPHCVVKQFLPNTTDTNTLQAAKRLFDLEAQTLYKLGTHPQIPTLLAHFEQSEEFYLVQEYIPGESLQSELKEKSKANRTVYSINLLTDLLTILTFVHQNNVIHRDIKPANLILRRSNQQGDQQLVLIDFGAVKTFSKSNLEKTVAIGSPGYIAPEQQAGRPCFASDLYAAGIIGLQALTNQSPDQYPTDPTTGHIQIEPILKKVIKETDNSDDQEQNAEQTTAFIQFIQKLISPEPRDRYPNAAAALSALQSLTNNLNSTNLESTNLESTNLIPTTEIPTTDDIAPTTIPPDTTNLLSKQSNTRASTTNTPTTKLKTHLTSAQPATPADRNRQALLNKVHRFWIEGVLEHSLHGQVLLTLGLEEREQALALPWNISWKTEQTTPQPLDAGTRVFDLFNNLGEGRSLLILGEPGAGKTTTLLTLARDLLNQWQPHQRIPAVFNLSSWTGEAIEQWLITELNSKYQIPKGIGQTWVKQQQLLLLLDGLDEVRADRRDSVATAINQFYQDYGPELVVCCRVNDYDALEQKLSFQSAVYVRSLTDTQIWEYLNSANTGLTGLRSLLEQSTAKRANADGQTLLDLARSPLILNIMALTYQGISASEIPALSNSESYTHQLFSAYIERMFQRRDIPNSYTKQQTVRWLRSLALNLTHTSQTVFLIERMQVNWLTSKAQRAAYVILVFASFLVISTTIGWHVVSRHALPLALLIGGAICARIFGIYRIVPAEKLRWSWSKAKRALFLGITLGPLIGWALKLTFVYTFSPSYCLKTPGCFQYVSTIGLSFGIVLGITYGLIRGLSGSRITLVTKPNQGIRQSAKNAIIFAIIATIAPFITSLSFQGNTSPAFWAAAGLSFGLAAGGGEACVKHGVLRFVLFCQGRIPWNYARFLNYATERIFLQRVGGGYIFIHRLLLEHFANLPRPKR